jgi:hypothetical protein
MNLAFLGDALDHWKALETRRAIWHGVKEEARRVPRNRLNSRVKSWDSRRKAFLAVLRLRDRSTHLINASSPRRLILTVSLLWFNFRIARNSGIELFEALFVFRAHFYQNA